MIRLLLLFITTVLSASASLNVTQLSGFGVRAVSENLDPETLTWRSRVNAAGGTFETNSVALADALIVQLKTKSYESKIKYLLPLLGSNLAAARVPLRDTLGVGIATNTNFVDANFSQATGLQGNGTSRYLDLLIKPSQLGTGSNGGIGYWEKSVSFSGTGVEPIGVYGVAASTRFVIDLRSAVRNFRWGTASNGAGDTTAAGNGHYYGQRSSATLRRLYFNGSTLASNTTSDAAAGTAEFNIRLLGCYTGSSTYWAGRCAVAYLTDGTLSDADAADLHTLLTDYLITPTGR